MYVSKWFDKRKSVVITRISCIINLNPWTWHNDRTQWQNTIIIKSIIHKYSCKNKGLIIFLMNLSRIQDYCDLSWDLMLENKNIPPSYTKLGLHTLKAFGSFTCLGFFFKLNISFIYQTRDNDESEFQFIWWKRCANQ